MNSDNNIAMAYLLNLLARRDYSAEEIRQKMNAKAFNSDEIEQTLLLCQQKGWQSDQRFCENYLLMRSRKGYGPVKIKQELQQKGIENSLINEQLQQSEIDWFTLAESVFTKKYHHISPNEWTLTLKQKAWRFMLSHGFNPSHFSHLIHVEID